MKYMLVTVGRVRSPFVEADAHYRKLLSGYARLEIAEARDDDGARRRIPDRSHVVALEVGGFAPDSQRLAAWLGDRQLDARDLCFVIGGADGIEIEGAQTRLSLGQLTLPHQLARVVLLEQLYRAHRILAGEPYHR